MLYSYKNKFYVKVSEYKLVEVTVNKDKEYNVVPTKNIINITTDVTNELTTISVEDAYNKINSLKKSNF